MAIRRSGSSSNVNRGGARGGMTVQEAGRKGGETVLNERGPEFFSQIGRKGGQKVRELINAGKRGGNR
jgi:general stress protein YciG